MVQQHGVVLVCGTPCSGKSALGWLMVDYAQQVLGEKVAYIKEWNHAKSPEDNLFDACKHLPEVRDAPAPFSVIDCGVFFVINEAQTTYTDKGFWDTYLKSSGKTRTRTKFLLLARHV
jgi:hypothetical protein